MFVFCRQTVTLFPRLQLLLGFIVSSLARRDRTWLRLPNKCPRSAQSLFCTVFSYFKYGCSSCLFCSAFKVHIEFTEGEEKIILEGPTKDVQMVQSQIEAIVTDLV